MSFLDKIRRYRQLVSKRRIPPKGKLYQVTKDDYETVKFIRLSAAMGKTAVFPPEMFANKEWLYANAKILHKYFDMSRLEVLVSTGYWVGGNDAK